MNLQAIVSRFGKGTFVVILFVVAFNHWGIVNLSGIPMPHLIDILYGYLLLNGAAATPFIYLERRARVRAGKNCPRCGELLEEITNFTCPKCGQIRFDKKDS